MNRKRILIISPKFFPVQDGLGHYTTYLHEYLHKYHDSFVLTSSANASQIADVYPVVEKWNIIYLLKTARLIREINPDIILVQYLPFLYQPRGGINFSISFFILYLKFIQKRKIHLMFHEIYYPWQWSIKAIIMHIAHLLMGKIAILGTDKIFASTEENARIIMNKLGLPKDKQVHVQKISSNITMMKFSAEEIKRRRESFAIAENQKLIGFFGSLHPSKKQLMVIKELIKIHRLYNFNFKLLYVGVTIEEILSQLSTDEKDYALKMIIATGFSHNADVSLYFQMMDGFIGYFVDGITSRRGSVLAAFQHGVPVLSTINANSDKLFCDVQFIKLLSCDEEKFKKELADAFYQGWPPLKKNNEKNFYEKNFSWDVIIKEYLSHLNL